MNYRTAMISLALMTCAACGDLKGSTEQGTNPPADAGNDDIVFKRGPCVTRTKVADGYTYEIEYTVDNSNPSQKAFSFTAFATAAGNGFRTYNMGPYLVAANDEGTIDQTVYGKSMYCSFHMTLSGHVGDSREVVLSCNDTDDYACAF